MTTRRQFNQTAPASPLGKENGRFDYTLKKQSGGPGQYARVIGWLEACSEPFAFENRVAGGAIGPEFIKACEQGFRDAASSGVLAGYPVIGVKVILSGGNYHPVDSNERAFRFAACQGFYQAMRSADPIIIEPAMQVTVEVPASFVGSVQGDLRTRRGILLELENMADQVLVQAVVPLSEMFSYATRLRSLCSGQGNFSMTFSHYQPVPDKVQQQLIAGTVR